MGGKVSASSSSLSSPGFLNHTPLPPKLRQHVSRRAKPRLQLELLSRPLPGSITHNIFHYPVEGVIGEVSDCGTL